MTDRDDIVFNPSIGRQNVASPRARAKQERALERHRRRRGAIARIARARAAKRAATRARRSKAGAKRMRRSKALRKGGFGMATRAAGFVGKRAATAAVANPIGIAVGALVAGAVIAGAVTLRLASGRSFENMGEQVNKMLLGDLDDEGRARMTTRRYLQGDSDLARINAASGGENAQIQKLSQDLFELNKREEKGASLVREDERFQSNGVFDMLILRAQQVFLHFWNSNGGPDGVERVRDRLQENYQRRHRNQSPR